MWFKFLDMNVCKHFKDFLSKFIKDFLSKKRMFTKMFVNIVKNREKSTFLKKLKNHFFQNLCMGVLWMGFWRGVLWTALTCTLKKIVTRIFFEIPREVILHPAIQDHFCGLWFLWESKK